MVGTLVDDVFVPADPIDDAFFEVTAFGDFFTVEVDGVTFAPSVGTLVENACFFATFGAVPLDFF